MKTPPVDYAALEPDDHYLADLGWGIWLMDNHRWALLVWERHRRGRRFDLVHVDHHFDACDDFSADVTTAEAVCNATLEQIARILEEGKLVRFDSFIAPAVARELVGTVHFYCTESDHDVELGLYQPLVDRAEASQVIHESVESLAAARFERPILFDLCLDLFNRSDNWGEGDLWTEAEITEFLRALRPLVTVAEVVTVSLSFDYSGTPQDTRWLAQLVCPILLAFRAETVGRSEGAAGAGRDS